MQFVDLGMAQRFIDGGYRFWVAQRFTAAISVSSNFGL
jgi:hypothetical protein